MSSDPSARGGKPAGPVPEAAGCEEWAVELLPRLRKMVGSRYGIPEDDCEDVVQSAVVDFLLQSRRYGKVDPGLLVVIARRRCADFWRTQQLRARHMISIEAVPEGDSRHPMSRGDEYAKGLLDGIALALAWTRITSRCQKLLSERFFRQAAVRDIARAIGDNEGTVKRYMSRCLAKLRTIIEGRA